MYNFLGDINLLLQTHSCVILPSIGAFITNPQSAEISFIDKQIVPPSFGITFNELVNQNDGILINTHSIKNKISYKQAQTEIFQYCDLINTQLKMHEVIVIPEIGTLQKTIEGQILFKSYTKNRIANIQYFGLKPITIEPILREDRVGVIKDFVNLDNASIHETLTHQPKFSKLKSNNFKKYFEIAAAAVFVILLLTSIINVKNNKKQYIQSANIISCFVSNISSNNNKNDITNNENKWVDSSNLSFFKEIRKAIIDSNWDTLSIENSTINLPIPIDSIVNLDTTKKKVITKIINSGTDKPKQLKHHYSYYLKNPALPYYMIVGQFESKEQANKIKTILRNNGEDARIIQYDKTFCVGLYYFVNNAAADSILAQLVSNRFASAFIIAAVQ
jgi:hypothetical protein